MTGLKYADSCDVEVNLVLDAKTLLAGGDTPVELDGYGPISPDVADEIIARAPNASIRRLLIDPVDGTLIVREPRRRRFDRPTSAHIRTRDRSCRQPGCDLQIRDDDHIQDYQFGGPTTADNGQGLCARSHTIKHQPGWTVKADGKTTIWRTPTGHQYRSTPPPILPGHLRQ
nr:endonuclease [Aeromicrobium sp.]